MSGLPVIVPDRAYLAADAERLGFGLSFDPSAPGRLSEPISLLAANDAQVAQMSRNGIAHSSEPRIVGAGMERNAHRAILRDLLASSGCWQTTSAWSATLSTGAQRPCQNKCTCGEIATIGLAREASVKRIASTGL
jgi:hypothetical protein